MKKLIKYILPLALTFLTPGAQAEYLWGFFDTGLHYLDWTQNTTHRTGMKSHKDDFFYLELEGGAGFTWGETYGFFDLENPLNKEHDQPGDEQRYTFKSTNRFYLGNSGFNLYGHLYGTYGAPLGVHFHDVMALYGIGYNIKAGNFWYKPFIAKRYTDQTYYTGDNGYVFGWAAGYDFTAWGENFSLTNWTEYEFDRADQYAAGNGGKEGINGGAGFWWKPNSSLTVGLQYRYADNKLGESFLQDGIIYSIKYNF